jgi:hypothetical protein
LEFSVSCCSFFVPHRDSSSSRNLYLFKSTSLNSGLRTNGLDVSCPPCHHVAREDHQQPVKAAAPMALTVMDPMTLMHTLFSQHNPNFNPKSNSLRPRPPLTYPETSPPRIIMSTPPFYIIYCVSLLHLTPCLACPTRAPCILPGSCYSLS